MGWRGFPGKRWAPIREGITTTARSGWRTSNGNPSVPGAGYHPRVSGRATRSSPSPLRTLVGSRAAALVVLVAVIGALALGAGRRARDPLRPAQWIGFWPAAARAEPAMVAFVREVDLASAFESPRLEAEGDLDWSVTLDGKTVGSGHGPGARRFDLEGPLAAGRHVLVALVRHPTGVASIRLRLSDAAGKGIGVVTGRGWGADDDASRVRDRGRKGARYRAMVWGRPPLSSWSASSVTRSLTRNGGSSIDAESSRIPSRAETQ